MRTKAQEGDFFNFFFFFKAYYSTIPLNFLSYSPSHKQLSDLSNIASFCYVFHESSSGNISAHHGIRQHPTCGRHDILRAFTAELRQKTCLARTREAYANQVILRSWRWRSLAAKCSKTLPG